MNTTASAFDANPDQSIFIVPTLMWIVFAVACVAIGVAFEPSLRKLMDGWFQSEEFNYGPILPVVFGFLVWQQRDLIEREPFVGSWQGFIMLGVGAALAFVGQIATVPVLSHVGVLLAFAGLTWAATGTPVFRKLLGAFAVLLLAIPWPAFLMNNLSLQLQLLSSKLGVAIVRMMNISVYLEGNVIDLGAYRLEVAEACSGLRYLFPLMTLGFLMAYMFKAPMWKRIVLFLSSVPIAILMNSIRIGAIGVMVNRWGTSMAEGFVHDFQGWAVFMVSAGVMVAEMAVLARVGGGRRSWREAFGLEFPPPRKKDVMRIDRQMRAPLIASAIFSVAVAAIVTAAPQRVEAIPERKPLILYPSQIASWSAQRAALDKVYLDALKLDDYYIADYFSATKQPINFYVAWYNSQRSGQSAHSPRACLPGGGWQIEDLRQFQVEGVGAFGGVLTVNRAVVSNGRQKQLMYYWFQQRGRIVRNEYAVKWYLFWDALTRNRTDGALIRLMAPIESNADAAAVDKNLSEFLQAAAPELSRFIPG